MFLLADFLGISTKGTNKNQLFRGQETRIRRNNEDLKVEKKCSLYRVMGNLK